MKTKTKAKPKSVKTLANQYLKYWQKQLRLLDWEFKLEISTNPEDFFGRNIQNPNYQSAIITLLHPDSIPKDWSRIADLEVTLVHELLHTRLMYAIGKRCDHHGEMAIETIAVALVANKRGIPPEDLE